MVQEELVEYKAGKSITTHPPIYKLYPGHLFRNGMSMLTASRDTWCHL